MKAGPCTKWRLSITLTRPGRSTSTRRRWRSRSRSEAFMSVMPNGASRWYNRSCFSCDDLKQIEGSYEKFKGKEAISTGDENDDEDLSLFGPCLMLDPKSGKRRRFAFRKSCAI